MNPPLQKVLCVDDEDDILEIVQLCLSELGGLQVSCHNDVEDALQEAATLLPDLIMLDVMMPKMTGVTAIRMFRQIKKLERTPIILMTARVQPNEVGEYLANGATSVIAKPFDPMTLSQQVFKIWDECHGGK